MNSWTVIMCLLSCGYVWSDKIYQGSGEESTKALEYVVEDEYSFPVMSRDVALLAATIERIEDEICRDHVRMVIEGIQNLTTWAVKFYDASGKFPEGLLAGSSYQLGNFDECLQIGDDDGTPPGLSGMYCLGDVDIDVPEDYANRKTTIWEKFRKSTKRYDESIKRLHWGICVPAVCTSADIQQVIQKILDLAFSGNRVALDPSVDAKRCYKRQTHQLDTFDILYIAIISGIALIIALGTLFHIMLLRRNRETKGIISELLISFSLISNIKKLFGPPNDDGLNLDCISGIKFLAMGFIIAGHCLVFVIGGPVLNINFWSAAVTKIENAVFLNNPLLVDTFLLLSAFLFTRIVLKVLDNQRSVNFLFLYILRYIRLTPAYLVTLGLYVTWLSRLDSGPLWYKIIDERERCQASWWINILYVNNYVNTDQLCMFQSWYLSVDTQLFILAPAIIYPLWKWRKIGELLLGAATFISLAVPFGVTLFDRLDPTLMAYREEIEDISTNEFFRKSYIKTHMRASAYFFGLAYGYFLYRIQTADYKLTRNCVRIGWVLASLSLITSMFSIGLFYGLRKDYGAVEAAIYSSMHRALWSFGTGWVLIACITDNSGPIRNLLKCRIFHPLSRLTYSAYLVNGLVELHGVATTRTPQHLDNLSLLAKVLSHLILTFMGATVLSLMFEAPILRLEKVFLRSVLKNSDRPKTSRGTISEESVRDDNCEIR
ncbi:nose resistant to fluoxetine protein 6 [Fopius arisanus]|uniref:Nose resistant to fluoxetine protein 6 n=1 Tax=Fopius arisanus TaxID=64838 RepID=A0A9R1SX76_9HYME|nr:PREDICTED: nose resistant to fluoxetine protein 6-like [Fopius arisanus]